MNHPEFTGFPAILLTATLLSACATSPQPATPLPSATEAGTHQTSPEPTRPQPLCAWSQIRGIATLLSTTSALTDPTFATWQFFPGDDIVFHRLPQGANTGDEYKALLRRPMTGPCQPELYLVAPLLDTEY
ncbi:hypothetical protein [Marinobacter zhejiangensis]|uniref:Uncharacterized protein n=1 Tax=Marinobacter zhejiangensis TaxID=488535 RepID=A0A1I4MDZ4_9GAMM|nr:hypothetical protein [Marinobacter zhejiangensis]SFM01622.1 hypothetical protein SAMN04487963_1027 [Marinobacter zhejiangensis]